MYYVYVGDDGVPGVASRSQEGMELAGRSDSIEDCKEMAVKILGRLERESEEDVRKRPSAPRAD